MCMRSSRFSPSIVRRRKWMKFSTVSRTSRRRRISTGYKCKHRPTRILATNIRQGLAMTLMLSNDDDEKVLTMPGAIEALEDVYRDLGNGSAVNRGRTDIFAPTVAEIGADVPSAHQFKTLD